MPRGPGLRAERPHSRGRSGRGRPFLVPGILAALIGAGTAPGLCADPARELESVEERLAAERAARDDLQARREALAEDLRRVRAQVIDSAAAVQDAEESLSRLEERLEALRAERDRMAVALSMRDQQLARVLTAIQRLAWHPTEALLIQPASPADTVRTAILLRAAIPRIEDQARALARELETLAGLDAAILAQRAEIREKTEALKVAHSRLESLFDRKTALQRDTLEREREAAQRVERLGREAEDLRGLMRRLEEERVRREALEAQRRAIEARRQARANQGQGPATTGTGAGPDTTTPYAPAAVPTPAEEGTDVASLSPPPALAPALAPPVRAFPAGKGNMPIPVRGRVVTRYGEPDADGVGSSKGLTVRPRGNARVVAPYDGTVAFAGPFRGYGLLLIIEHTDGYHSLLAGMSRLDSRVGQTVRAGEPVGVMGSEEPALYIELRRDGRPINPLPWMAAGSDIGKG